MPDPAPHPPFTTDHDAIRAEMARELLDGQDDACGCSFDMCPGPDVEPIDMATCAWCRIVHDLRVIAGRPAAVSPALSAAVSIGPLQRESIPITTGPSALST